MKYKFSTEQYKEIKAAQRKNRDKQIANRLKVLVLRCEGKRIREIEEATGFGHAHITNLIRKYFEAEYERRRRGGIPGAILPAGGAGTRSGG